MTLKIAMVTIDCANPRLLAEFYTKALGTEIAHDYGEFIFLAPATEGGPAVGLQKVPEERAGKNRLHLDLTGPDREAEVERLVGLGASKLDQHTIQDFTWQVLADPEGNQFCVATHG